MQRTRHTGLFEAWPISVEISIRSPAGPFKTPPMPPRPGLVSFVAPSNQACQVLFPIVHISFTGAMLNEPAQWFEFSFGAALRHFSKKCWLETWIIGAIERKGVTVIEKSPPMNGMAVFSVEEMDAPGYRAITSDKFPEQLKALLKMVKLRSSSCPNAQKPRFRRFN